MRKKEPAQNAKVTNWIARWIRPVYGRRRGMPEEILAPDLRGAFVLARSRWPSAEAWECLGRVGDAVDVSE